MARILVIDDEVQLRGVVRRILERAGHDVVEAGDGDEGLKRHREHGADLVLLDIFMPGRDGIELIRDLRAEAPETKIVVMSGGGRRGNLDLLDDARMLGASRSLRKPFELAALLALVREMLGEPPAP
ncbi:MAG TPA: response regulator [Gemmatimonadales bacterium]|jgi:CheY-like chemotaxis protein|nr:response regulator [Gemmatimonadales bacterium]